ncbi:polysaccharide pyruvyl transferase family protein [Sphingomonas sp. TDK1]|uniref:polysaccharide pyruvyl transferase family protein n=1 Tax=Sphingomonas sp. TDK1 TaxID=453247 RepID=UPI0007D96F7A|nr:polysaccharide pyruvyl transferase family protein [Sphingomonas sp. TDK1]OAN57566.1 exopolysaccharide biosynthesis protein [Sphingomonas sp. TDK1]
MTDVVTAQQALLQSRYRAHIGPSDAYALVDFPDHANVGDSAIWLGECRMLRAITGRAPDYISTWHDFDPLAFRQACPSGTLFLHGGGNLGDLWPHHQQFREALLGAVRDRPVVQLPQSIHFTDDGALSRFAERVACHPDFTLHVRDRESLAIAAAHFACQVHLTPDSAFALGPQPRGPDDTPILALMRTDIERKAVRDTSLSGATIVDWLEDDADLPQGTDSAAREAQARARVARGLRLLSRGTIIATDRLHGHILATLLGIPHTVFDNSYGKLGAYIRAWTATSPLVRRADDRAAPAAAPVAS